jgi:hypothetical protein
MYLNLSMVGNYNCEERKKSMTWFEVFLLINVHYNQFHHKFNTKRMDVLILNVTFQLMIKCQIFKHVNDTKTF